MVNEKHLTRVLHKAERLESTYAPYLFPKVDEVAVGALACDEHLYVPPEDGYAPIARGDTWGREWGTLWLRGTYTVPAEYAGAPLYVLPRLGGWEGFLYISGAPRAIFTNKYTVDTHGNHYAARITSGSPASETLDLAFEYYAGHHIPGQHPFDDTGLKDFTNVFEEIAVCTKDALVSDFLFDLHVLNSLCRALPENSFRRGDLVRGLCAVVDACVEDPAAHAGWREGLSRAREIMRPLLAAKNAASAPVTAVVGHSHMDTAWLWPVDETIRKCARTYANALSLMEEYPEFMFFQSSSYHSELIRRHYPALFERIREKVREGRYEPGGAVWIECDCNVTGGESMVRQFLWGQKYTEKQFGGFRSNNFWLPDTFGYSAAIPQIMKGCGVEYFFTTKLSWNDTNVFPYDSFYWEGLDGTRVFTHFNATHCYPDPETLLRYTAGEDGFTQEIKNKAVSRRKLIAYGYGDGGGGPEFESIEYARREADLDGCPRTAHRTVQDFAVELEREAKNAPVHRGELYLELHRGTLTSKHQIKRNNRKGEQALHDLEVLTCLAAVRDGAPADDTAIRPLMETLLKNQFHDILPGSCIERAHRESIAEMEDMIKKAAVLQAETLGAKGDGVTAFNPLGFAREDTVYAENADVPGQRFTDVFGRDLTAVEGVCLPACGTATLPTDAVQNSKTPFVWDENGLETPFYTVKWDENGGFAALFDKRVGREVRSGLPLNTFLLAEDVPYLWDNWDIDPDAEDRFRPCGTLLSRTLVSAGESQLRFRQEYRLTDQTTLAQDVVFYARRPVIEFHTRVDWNETHAFLKTAFDTDIRTDFSAHEIQFGCIRRPATRNNDREQAMFETCSHKYTDLSEPRYGVSVLSDCKYGVSVRGGSIRLSLHKAGLRPDDAGDSGVHDFVYALLPHEGALSAEETVRAGYLLNNPPLVFRGAAALPDAPITVGAPNIIIEAVKPLHETAARTLAVRLYECEGSKTNCAFSLAPYVTAAEQSNLLEEPFAPLSDTLIFRPFEIKTLLLHY